jgi:BirA family biotin operon repressor/biotin-[acetyl-CoA-carboxylase] ligase
MVGAMSAPAQAPAPSPAQAPAPSPAWDVRRFATIGSTNSYLLDEARAGAPAGTVAVADHQRAGRGRLDRRWEAPPGTCLLVSVLLRPTAPPAQLFACTAAAGLAMADACRVVAGVEPVLKWPNDLLVANRKLAGVLAEADPSAPGGPPGSVAVVVGVGCNVGWPGPDPQISTSLESEAGDPVDREALLDALLASLACRVPFLDTEPGRRSVVAELRARCTTIGRQVRVEGAAGVQAVVGGAAGIGDAGHLVVVSAEGVLEVADGDVVHVRPVAPTAGTAARRTGRPPGAEEGVG